MMRPTRRLFAQWSHIDRRSTIRDDSALIRSFLAHPELRILASSAKNHVLMHEAGDFPRKRLDLACLADPHGLSSSADLDSLTFLGVDSTSQAPVFMTYFDSLESIPDNHRPESASFMDLRLNNPFLSESQSSVAMYVKAMCYWQRSSGFCPKCGSPSNLIHCGHVRKCSNPDCGFTVFPRHDPAMITLVESLDGQQVLLGRQAMWAPLIHSTLAGFVEVGESFEDAVVREVFEEAGVLVDKSSVQYLSSQPWPFPQSTMVAFRCKADSNEPIQVDTDELESAAWFDKHEVQRAADIRATMDPAIAKKALQESGETVDLLIPPNGTSSRLLIEAWLQDTK